MCFVLDLVPLQVRSPTKNEELRLPVRNMTRIMQRALPSYAKISQDAKASTQMCVLNSWVS